ncbi:DHA2 family efflux MFS transporter permease subunit [Acinetobacter albensis]|uniref:DHA2 family efflux MFS transporter permease subunit n=1 Tax=Acinetobacter albensis TaxID=1673609 RepID=UPI00187F1A1D|nr:DHA2 family efflux MFS transporter permease subunit [Acinetobacter albensis]MBE9402140.1 DHA2 family efflux MFS transporter permease subunit [Acinetobacter albensis]
MKSEQNPSPKSVIFTILLGAITVSLNNSALNPALPEFMQIFHVGPALASWILAAFMLAMSLTLPVTGYLSQNLGKRRIYMTGLALFVFGSILGSMANNIYLVIMARSLQGIASGLILPLSLAFIFSVTEIQKRGRITSLWASTVMFSLAIGPFIGAIILATSRWEMLFLLNIPIALFTFILAAKHLTKDQNSTKSTFDWVGFSLITCGLGYLIWTCHQIKSWQDLTSSSNFVALGLAFGCLLFFIFHQLKSKAPLLNLRLFQCRHYSLSVMIVMIQTVAMFECLVLLPLLIQEVFNFNPIWTGIALLTTALSASLSLNLAGKVLDLHGPRNIVMLGLVLSAIAMFALGQLSIQPHNMVVIIVLMTLRGIGIGFSVTPLTTAGLNYIAQPYLVEATAMHDMVRRTASSIAIVFVAIYLEIRSSSFMQQGLPQLLSLHVSINEVFLATGGLIALTLPCAYFLASKKQQHFSEFSTEPSLINGLDKD